jgi:hypothetical protein
MDKILAEARVKPHDQRWTLAQKILVDPSQLTWVVSNSEGVVGAFLFLSEAQQAASASAGAEALMAFLEDKRGSVMTRQEAEMITRAEQALRAAGVLP